jgi:hypothetical protein
MSVSQVLIGRSSPESTASLDWEGFGGVTYEKQLEGHRHRRTRPCTYPNCTQVSRHYLAPILGGSSVMGNWIIEEELGWDHAPLVLGLWRSVRRRGSLPIVNDEGGYFLWSRKTGQRWSLRQKQVRRR